MVSAMSELPGGAVMIGRRLVPSCAFETTDERTDIAENQTAHAKKSGIASAA